MRLRSSPATRCWTPSCPARVDLGWTGLALGAEDWAPLETGDLTRLVGRLRDHPVQVSRLSTRYAEHGRGRMLVALLTDPGSLDEALRRPVQLFGFLAPAGTTDPLERSAYVRVVTRLMRLTALQLLLAERAEAVPPGLIAAWPLDDRGGRRPVGRRTGSSSTGWSRCSTTTRCWPSPPEPIWSSTLGARIVSG